MSAYLFEANPLLLRLNAARKGDDPLTVEAIAIDGVDRMQNATSGEAFLHTLATVEENLRVLEATIAELESIWAEDGQCT